MSKKLYEEENIQDIADAIREKNGSQNTYTVSQMGNAVRAIHTNPVLESLSVSENGTYMPGTGKDGFDEVHVAVPSATLTTKSITQNGTYIASSDNADGYSQVTVNVSGGSASNNDLLFHFNQSLKNSGKESAVFSNTTGLTISDEQSKFGGHSLKCGTSQTPNNVYFDSGFDLGTNDFTLDFWCYPTNLSSSSTLAVPISFYYRSLAIYMRQNMCSFGISKDGGSWFDDADISIQITNNEWHHVAVVRDSSNIYCYLDGVKVRTVDFGNDSLAPIGPMTLGSNTYSSGDRRFNGYIDELRLKIGEAVWTSDFTPPTQPYV